MDNNSYIFHITCVTHNSRISDRMKRFKIKTGTAVCLDNNQEIILTNIICDVVQQYKFIILAYNICKDHIHFVLLSEKEKLSIIVNTIKSISSREFYKRLNLFPKLWAEKFNRKVVDKDQQLTDTINYVKYNRIKHNLEENNELEKTIAKMITPIESIFK